MHHLLGMSVRGARALSLFTFPIVAGALALALVGCSGAGNADLFDDSSSAGNDTSSINPAPSAPAKSAASNDPAASAPPAPVKPGETPGPKDPAPPAADCTQEVEPNNVAAKATPFASCLAGKIDSRDDVDWGTFTAPKGAKAIVLKHAETNGAVSYAYYMNGLPLFAEGSDRALDLVPGATYAVQIRSAQAGNGGNTRPTYQLDISFQ